jgi:hypothetical protein
MTLPQTGGCRCGDLGIESQRPALDRACREGAEGATMMPTTLTVRRSAHAHLADTL